MEADSSQRDACDSSEMEEYGGSSELDDSFSDIALNTSPDLNGLSASLQSSSYDTSSKLQLISLVDSEISTSTLETSLAHPLSSSEASTVKSECTSELSYNNFVCGRRNSAGDEDSCDAESSLNQSSKYEANKTAKGGFLKNDILEAMKADFCKMLETELNEREAENTELAGFRSGGEFDVVKDTEVIKNVVLTDGNEEKGTNGVEGNEKNRAKDIIGNKEGGVNGIEGNEENGAKEGNEENRAKDIECNEENGAKDIIGNKEEGANGIEGNEENGVKDIEDIEEKRVKDTESTEEKKAKDTEGNEEKEAEVIIGKEANETKDNDKTEAKSKKGTEDCSSEEENIRISKEVEEQQGAADAYDVEMQEVTKDNRETVVSDEEAKGTDETAPQVNEEMEAKVTVDKATERPEAGDNETVKDEVNNTSAVQEDAAVKKELGTANTDLVSQAEVTKSIKTNVVEQSEVEPSETMQEDIIQASEADNFPGVEMKDFGSTGDRISEAMETEECVVKKDKEVLIKTESVESSEVMAEASTVAEAVISEPVEPGTSGTNLKEEKDVGFTYDEDSRGSDSLLSEEVKRLDKLDIPIQVAPEREVEGGEQEREKQYKKLVDLLSKSKFYTDVLLEKVEADVAKYSRKRKHSDSDKNGDVHEEKGSPSKSPSKRKKILMENQRTMYQVASEVIKSGASKQTRSSNVADANAAASQSFGEVKHVEQIKPPKLLTGGTLRDYQLEGFNWLKVLYENGVNGILADEMGLGKTVQVIALLCHLVEMKVKGPFLIVGPLSTLPNWMIEFKRFAPQLHVTLFYGTKVERKRMYGSLKRRRNVNGVLCFPIVVTSYEVPVFERSFMQSISWKYIIVDEGHRIKNYNTVLAKVLREFDSANRLLLTGTPLHNSLSELWSLLNFLVPEIFDNLEVFESWFRIEELSDDAGRKKIIEEERRKNVLSTLHQILGPFMLRRVKSEVTLDIPKKKEVVVQAPMTDMQLKLYQAILDKNINVLKRVPIDELIIPEVDGKRPKRSCTIGKNYEEKSDPDVFEISDDGLPENKNDDIDAIVTHYIRVKMQNPCMALKQIASHPYLIHYPLQEDGESCRIDEAVVNSSGKFLVLDAMLEKLHARGHKVLIFSTLCLLLDIVEDYLSLRTYNYERLDGTVKIADRAESILRFNTDPTIFLFLLSTRAGGLGVNLTGADTVIFLDSDWNPQVDLQAQDRCHRIGQTKPVMVYRLVTTGTMEEQILRRAGAKRVLEKMVICKGTSYQKEFNLEELKTILESRDYSEIVHTDGQVLTDDQLEKLLDRTDLLN